MGLKNMSKNTKNNFVTYAIVVVAFLVIELLTFSGVLSNWRDNLFRFVLM